MQRFLVILSIMLIGCASINSKQKSKIGYQFDTPDLTLIVPDTLREISGLTILDSVTFATIQDENGILFLYDIDSNKVKHQYVFHVDGDYEGITKTDSSLFVLRSDGVLFEILNYQQSNAAIKVYQTGIPADNNEGLCYDAKNNRLLIACKGKIAKGSEFKDKRVIYGFDLKTKTLTNDPVFDFDVQTIIEFATKNHLEVPVKTRTRKGQTVAEPFIKFRTSAIGIHPSTQNLFMLSAADYMLFVFTTDGKLIYLEQLNPELFNKAEGISFFNNGDILITNEGQDKRPTVLRFNYKASN